MVYRASRTSLRRLAWVMVDTHLILTISGHSSMDACGYPCCYWLDFLAKKRLILALPLLTILILEVYVNASTRDWFAGAGYGPRRFASELIIFGVGYAMFLDWFKPHVRRYVSLLFAIFLGLHQWILLRFGIVERIGGFKTSMYPTYLWEEESMGVYLWRIVSHVPDMFKMPADFFIFHNAPLRIWQNSTTFPTYLLSTTIVTIIFAYGYWWVGKRIMKAFDQQGGRAWLVGLTVLLGINGWILWLS